MTTYEQGKQESSWTNIMLMPCIYVLYWQMHWTQQLFTGPIVEHYRKEFADERREHVKRFGK